jgi:hypothetical protein
MQHRGFIVKTVIFGMEHSATQEFQDQNLLRKKLYKMCHRKFRIQFCGVSFPLKLAIHRLVNKFLTTYSLLEVEKQEGK